MKRSDAILFHVMYILRGLQKYTRETEGNVKSFTSILHEQPR